MRIDQCHHEFFITGDGLPSIASVDVDETSESSDLQKARKLYAELTAKSMSIDSRESQEVIYKVSILIFEIFYFTNA